MAQIRAFKRWSQRALRFALNTIRASSGVGHSHSWTENVSEQRLIAIASVMILCGSPVYADTFGNGQNLFNIEFVTIGNPSNPPDTTGTPNPAGAVPYTYRMGKFEISEAMIDKANVNGGLRITKNTRSAVQPATGMSWNEAARFSNWLNTSQGHAPAYKFARQPGEFGYDPNVNIELWQAGDTGFDATNPFRNSQAKYFLPSVDELYKSAYYDPSSGSYFDYPTGSDTAPTPVASGTSPDTAVYMQPGNEPVDVTQTGGLSPYGIMGQGGNVWEWEESAFDRVNNSPSKSRGVRGGLWWQDASWLRSSSSRLQVFLPFQGPAVGFRVASISEQLLLSDLTGNGFVDFDDLTLLLANWDTMASEAQGNIVMTDSTVVNFDDLTFLLSEWTGPEAAPAASDVLAVHGLQAQVPEPNTFVLVLIGLFGLSHFGWRRNRGRR